MELVIKPTNKCNFACTFCSSNKISNANFDIEILKKYIIQNNVKSLIVNGGQPLLMNPTFYEQIIAFLDQNKLSTHICITTNMWDFYINPDKWKNIFSNKRIFITTSFQYGPGRYLKNGQPFTEKLFLNIQDMYYRYFNKYINFISVITTQNQQYALDNVLLAKKLNVKCKLNGAVKSGKQTSMYDLNKLYSIYLNILKRNLVEWQSNTQNLINFFYNNKAICPLANRMCNTHIRCMQADMNISMCPALDDDNINNSEIYTLYKKQCYYCQHYMICNGCMKRIKDLMQENYDCNQLKKTLSTFKSICLNI